jgi:hypothetical protein
MRIFASKECRMHWTYAKGTRPSEELPTSKPQSTDSKAFIEANIQSGCINWAIEISQGAPKEQPSAAPAPPPPPPPAQPASCKIEDDGSGGKRFDVQWDKDLNGVDCNKIQAAINDAMIKARTKICVAAGSYPKMQIQVMGIDMAETGKMNDVLAGLFPDVKPTCA